MVPNFPLLAYVELVSQTLKKQTKLIFHSTCKPLSWAQLMQLHLMQLHLWSSASKMSQGKGPNQIFVLAFEK